MATSPAASPSSVSPRSAILPSSSRPSSRTWAFARTETAIQLAWVLGGGLGIMLPLNATLGMSVVAVGLLATLVAVARSFQQLRRQAAVRPVAPPAAAPPDGHPAPG